MTWASYVAAVAGDLTNTEIAQRCRLSQPSVSNWRNGATPSPDLRAAIAFARAFDRSIPEVLIAAGVASAEDFPEAAVIGIAALPDDQLVAELGRRGLAPDVMANLLPPEALAAAVSRRLTSPPGPQS